MILGSFFEPVKSISPDGVRTIIKEKSAEEYCLLDVRQPGEYAQGHIPGAKMIPLGELQARLPEMTSQRFTVVYCRSGNRSRSAVGILNGAGFDEAYNMEGGMLAYNGLVAVGPPEAGVFCFPQSLEPEQLAAMAWYIEDGSQKYYQQMKAMTRIQNEGDLFAELLTYKRAHKDDLFNLYKKMSGQLEVKDFPSKVLPGPPANVMAGCVNVDDAVNWSKDREISEVLDLMMSLEANTFDLYLKLGRKVKSQQARSVFLALSEKEKHHIETLASAFEKTI